MASDQIFEYVEVQLQCLMRDNEGEIVRNYTVGAAGVTAFRAVTFDSTGRLEHYDCSNTGHFNKFVGVTLDTGVENDTVRVKIAGTITDPSQSYGSSTVVLYAGTSGELVTSLPSTTLFKQELAVTDSGTSFIIQPKDAEYVEDGAGDFTVIESGEVISGHRIVRTNNSGKVALASISYPDHADSLLGLLIHSVSVGDMASVVEEGVVEEPSWSWIPTETLWFDELGRLTQTPPTTGFTCSVGYAITPTKVFVRIGTPIFF